MENKEEVEPVVKLPKYKMDHAKRGLALVININKYDPNPFKLEEREWSKVDVANLMKTLKYLEFDLDLAENLTKSQIIKRLQKIVSINHENSDCFLCVVMSHGTEDNIVTNNCELISFEEIMEPIKGCKSLFNKPKMFFFQACRGENEIKSRASSANSTKSDRGPQTTDHLETKISSKLQSNVNTNIGTKFENESDLLIYYSTLPNHLSWSVEKNEGTIFIKSLCDVFSDAYKNLPSNLTLAQMITRINESVSNKRIQISVPEFRMSKEISFLPKDVSRFLII
jgi:caspase 7